MSADRLSPTSEYFLKCQGGSAVKTVYAAVDELIEEGKVARTKTDGTFGIAGLNYPVTGDLIIAPEPAEVIAPPHNETSLYQVWQERAGKWHFIQGFHFEPQAIAEAEQLRDSIVVCPEADVAPNAVWEDDDEIERAWDAKVAADERAFIDSQLDNADESHYIDDADYQLYWQAQREHEAQFDAREEMVAQLTAEDLPEALFDTVEVDGQAIDYTILRDPEPDLEAWQLYQVNYTTEDAPETETFVGNFASSEEAQEWFLENIAVKPSRTFVIYPPKPAKPTPVIQGDLMEGEWYEVEWMSRGADGVTEVKLTQLLKFRTIAIDTHDADNDKFIFFTNALRRRNIRTMRRLTAEPTMVEVYRTNHPQATLVEAGNVLDAPKELTDDEHFILTRAEFARHELAEALIRATEDTPQADAIQTALLAVQKAIEALGGR